MRADALIDTGAILALLDRTDRWHRICVDVFPQLRLPLLTSEAVLTELFHLVGDNRSQVEAAWKFVRSGALILGTIEHPELPHIHSLMARYWDRPMYFADATLVHLAGRESISTILPSIMPISSHIELMDGAGSGCYQDGPKPTGQFERRDWENYAANRVAGALRATASCDSGEQPILRFLERLDHHLTSRSGIDARSPGVPISAKNRPPPPSPFVGRRRHMAKSAFPDRPEGDIR